MSKLDSYEEKCYRASHNWFVLNGEDFTLVDKISVGRVLQLQVFEKLFEKSQINADKLDVKSIIKRIGLEWSIRSVFSFFDRNKDLESIDYLLVYDVNNDPMIDALNIVGNSLESAKESVAAVYVDKNIRKKCKLTRKVPWFFSFTMREFSSVIKAFLITKKKLYGPLCTCIGDMVQDFSAYKARRIHKYFKFQFLQVSAEIKAVTLLLLAKRPKVVVLASDAHRVSRIFIYVCRHLNIKTVVYQHGATIWKYGYVPVYADYMMVWGKSSREWFEGYGVKSDKLVEIGNLRSDSKPVPSINDSNFSNTKRLYFLPNPIDREVTSKVIRMLITLCEKYNIDGVIKLHPSEKNIEYFNKAISNTLSNITINTGPIDEVGIVPGDIAIIVNSTAGIDCCLLGAYILNVQVENMPNPIDYEGAGVGIKVTIENYLSGFDELSALKPSAFLANRLSFIESQLGKLDGNVAQRACDFITNLAESK